ncbi:MAG: HEAT repeat domain-containing protein, partial [SAR324 cluster bacterium]|nr:HEAT repeat domain-containing protein [SAR324 cluster bacterium]
MIHITFSTQIMENEDIMKAKKKLKPILILFLGLIFITAGCSSIEKARSLHQQGQNDKALEMAQELLADDDNDEMTRLAAISLIGQIGGEKAGAILLPALDDPVVPIKNAAIKTIGKMGYAPASKKLLSIAMTSSGDTFEAIAGAIRDIGPPAIDLLVKEYTLSSNGVEKERYKNLMLAVGPSVASGVAKNMVGKSYFENRTNFELLIA